MTTTDVRHDAAHVQSDADAGERLVTARLDQLLAEHDPAVVSEAEFMGAQFDLGLAWVHFPIGYGGLGVSRTLQSLVGERLRTAGAPNGLARNAIGYLRPLFTCEEVWCQLFSEPGAGSDVASLATKAVLDGDEWTVNGQKVWTTLAHTARYGMLLARSNPDAEKHKGMTYFVVDMHAPGVEVRPLRQMTGDAEFNEVFFSDVRIPDSERLSDVGEGWGGAITTLMNERVSIGGTVGGRGSGAIALARSLWDKRADKDPVLRDRLMSLWVESEAHRLTSIRASAAAALGTPGPEGSTSKLHHAELNKRILELCVDLLGADGMLYDDWEMRRPEGAGGIGGIPQRLFLRSRANSIEGGTSEIMRNILGERVLGLPGEPRADKGRPWSEVPRN
jgi:alkylation response protein AidB-like acyl-CoA dehydrogenase